MNIKTPSLSIQTTLPVDSLYYELHIAYGGRVFVQQIGTGQLDRDGWMAIALALENAGGVIRESAWADKQRGDEP